MMQYDRYEKLIVIEKGVELINWPEDIPFVNASNIGSLHTLPRLIAALTDDDDERRCHWVHLGAEALEAHTNAYYDKEIPQRRKRRIDLTNDSDSESDETTENEKGTNKARPSKQLRTTESSKEVEAVNGSQGKGKGPGNGKGPMKGKRKGKGKVRKMTNPKAISQGAGNKENHQEQSGGNKGNRWKTSAHNGSTPLTLHN